MTQGLSYRTNSNILKYIFLSSQKANWTQISYYEMM